MLHTDTRIYRHSLELARLAARGSANEVVALLDVALAWGALAPDTHRVTRELADHLAAMLSRFR